MTFNEAIDFNVPAVHLSPQCSRQMIYQAAKRALKKIHTVERFFVEPPYVMERINRPDKNGIVKVSTVQSDNFIDLWNQKVEYKPLS